LATTDNNPADQTMDVPSLTTVSTNQTAVAFIGTESGNSGNPLGLTWPGSWTGVDDNTNGPPGTGAASSAGGFAEQTPSTPTTIASGVVTFGGGSTFGQIIAVVLAEPTTIAVTVRDERINYGANITISGFGFESTQGTGNVQLWSDPFGTISVDQPILSWSDTAITYVATQGGLDDNTTIFLVVRNDTGNITIPYETLVGISTYAEIIAAQAPDHWWTFDNTYDDIGDFGGSPFTSSSVGSNGFEATAISEGTTNSWNPNSGRRECPNSNRMNNTATINRLMGGWIRPRTIYSGLSCIYEEGGGVNNLCFLIGLGNRLIASFADTADDNSQVFSNFALDPNRSYHIMFRFSYTDPVREWTMYIDGVKQTVSSGNPLLSTDLDSHSGDISIGGPGSSLEVAGTDVTFVNVSDMLYSNWYSWFISKPDSDIVDLFRRGAVPDDIINSDTPANQQAALNALTALRPNAPLSIRIEPASGSTNAVFDADGIIFPEEATIWVEWRGTGTLTWTNLNGSNLREDKVYATRNGTVNIITPTTITLTGLQANSEVRLYQANTTIELGGVENSNTSESFSIISDAVDIVVHSLEFEYLSLSNVNTAANATIPIQQRRDRTYNNP
jgi:hypothetical protein